MSVMSLTGRKRHVVRTALIAFALIGGSSVGVSSASAAQAGSAAQPESAHTSYACTGSAPEICFSIYHNGGYVYSMTVQVKVNGSATINYSAENSSQLAPKWYTAGPYNVTNVTWGPPKTWSNVDQSWGSNELICGNASVAYVSGFAPYVTACVNTAS